MKTRTTKRALIASVISLVICISMLIGTTYAWFTDNVTSANNIIKSGNLDMTLEYWDGTAWQNVENSSEILDKDALWEPGYAQVIYLKLANVGSLAFKYQMGVNIISETGAVNKAGDSFKLSDFIYFDVMKDVQPGAFSTREEAMSIATQTTKIAEGFSVADSIVAGASDKYYAMVVYMPTTVGNEANHNGTAPVIELGLTAMATQLTYEADSFGIDYDDIALVSNAAELKAAVENGGNVMLANDIKLNVNGIAMNIENDESVKLNLNGYDIIGTTTASDASQILFTVHGELTVYGNGTIALFDNSGAAFNMSYENTAIMARGGDITLEKGVTVISDSVGEAMAYAVDVTGWDGGSTLNVNGAYLNSSYIAVRQAGTDSNSVTTVNFNGGIIQGDRKGYDLWNQTFSGTPTFNVNTAAGITYTKETGYDIYKFDSDTVLVSNAAELKAALGTNSNIIVVSDFTADADETITVPAGVTANLDLNGKTIDFVTDDADKNDDGAITSADNEVAIDVRGTLNLKNGTMTIEHKDTDLAWNGCTEIFYVAFNGALNVENATLKNLGGSSMAFVIDVVNATNTTLNVKKSNLVSSYIPVRIFNNGSGMNNVTIKDSDLTGSSRAFWVHVYSNADNGGRGIKDSTLNLDIFGNGNTFTATVKPARIIEFGFTDAINFDSNGNQITL